jgi:hypothetical protein
MEVDGSNPSRGGIDPSHEKDATSSKRSGSDPSNEMHVAWTGRGDNDSSRGDVTCWNVTTSTNFWLTSSENIKTWTLRNLKGDFKERQNNEKQRINARMVKGEKGKVKAEKSPGPLNSVVKSSLFHDEESWRCQHLDPQNIQIFVWVDNLARTGGYSTVALSILDLSMPAL